MGYINDDLSAYLTKSVLTNLQGGWDLGESKDSYSDPKWGKRRIYGTKVLTTEELSKMPDEEIMSKKYVGVKNLRRIRDAIRQYEAEKSGSYSIEFLPRRNDWKQK